jgi:hypothetical protein
VLIFLNQKEERGDLAQLENKMKSYNNKISENNSTELNSLQKVEQKIIAFSGAARVGKDTFAKEIIKQINLIIPNLNCEKYSFAYGVREELQEFIENHYQINPWTEVDEEKEIIRPLLIAHGNAKRSLSNNQYWIDFLCKKLKSQNTVNVAVISDLRFAMTENDEGSWVKKNTGLHIHLRRYEEQNGIKKTIKPVISFEKQNEPFLLKNANMVVDIKSFDNEKDLQVQVEYICEKIIMDNFSWLSK